VVPPVKIVSPPLPPDPPVELLADAPVPAVPPVPIVIVYAVPGTTVTYVE
jgi:hypothetical protein